MSGRAYTLFGEAHVLARGYAEKEGDARRFHPKLRPPVNPRELEIDPRNGMKVNFVFGPKHLTETILHRITWRRKTRAGILRQPTFVAPCVAALSAVDVLADQKAPSSGRPTAFWELLCTRSRTFWPTVTGARLRSGRWAIKKYFVTSVIEGSLNRAAK